MTHSQKIIKIKKRINVKEPKKSQNGSDICH